MEDLSYCVNLISTLPSVLDVFHMCGHSILGTIQENIAELVDVIGKVAPWMHLNKVEIRFAIGINSIHWVFSSTRLLSWIRCHSDRGTGSIIRAL